MEMYIFNNTQSRENKRITRIKELANKLGITFEEAELIANEISKRVKGNKKINNIVSLEKLSKKIVAKNLDFINLHVNHMQPVDPNALAAVVKEILKDALKQTKMIDVAKEKIENQELKKQLSEMKKDRERLKSALEGSLCGMLVYADPKGNIAAEEKLESLRKRVGEALRLSDALDTPVTVKPVMFFFGMDMGR